VRCGKHAAASVVKIVGDRSKERLEVSPVSNSVNRKSHYAGKTIQRGDNLGG
jgi:hypothetical protein